MYKISIIKDIFEIYFLFYFIPYGKYFEMILQIIIIILFLHNISDIYKPKFSLTKIIFSLLTTKLRILI